MKTPCSRAPASRKPSQLQPAYLANTHYVDDDIGTDWPGEEHGWPLEALAIAPVVPLELASVVMGRPTRLRRRSAVRELAPADTADLPLTRGASLP